MEAQSQHTRTDRLSPLQQLRAYKATSLSYQILMMAIFFDQKQKLEKTSPQYPHQRSAVTHTLNAPPATAGICLKLKLAALKTLYSKHSMFPNGHHRTRHGSVLRMPTKIKHNGQSQTKKELFFFHIPQGLDSTPRHGVNRAASTKTPANWLKEKTHKSKVFHKVEFYSHLRQSYFITEEFCFL